MKYYQQVSQIESRQNPLDPNQRIINIKKNSSNIGSIVLLSIVFFYALSLGSIDHQVKKQQKIIVSARTIQIIIYSDKENIDLLQDTLQSFFIYNNFPVKKITVAIQAAKSKQSEHIMALYSNLTWITVKSPIQEPALIDRALASLTSDLYLLCKAGYIFVRPGFIQESLRVMNQDSAISGVVLRAEEFKQQYNCSLLNLIDCGFSFEPAVYRSSDYLLMFNGGYSKVSSYQTNNSKFMNKKISIGDKYVKMGKHLYFLEEPFIDNLSQKKIQNRHFLSQENQNDYMQFQKSIFQPQKQKKEQFKKDLKQINQQLNQQIQQAFKKPNNNQNNSVFKLGVYRQIQTYSKLDYLNITHKKQFSSLIRHFINNKIEYKRYIVQPQHSQITQKLSIKNKQKNFSKQYQIDQKIKYQLTKNINNLSLSLADYYQLGHYFKSYPVSKAIHNEFCVIIEGKMQQYKGQKFEKLLQSIKNQVYPDFSLVFVVNGEIDLQFIVRKSKNLPSKSKIQIIADFNKIKSIGLFNQHKKFCSKNSVIVNLKAQDQIIGNHFFNVLDSAYQIPNLMFATFRCLEKDQKSQVLKESQNLQQSILHRFRIKNHKSFYPFLKTYRHQIARTSIVEYLTEFYYDEDMQSFYLRFYQTDSDVFQTYSLIQLAGKERTKFFDEFLVVRTIKKRNQTCYAQKQAFNQVKAQLKIPIQPLFSPLRRFQILPETLTPERLLIDLQKANKRLKNCLTQNQK